MFLFILFTAGIPARGKLIRLTSVSSHPGTVNKKPGSRDTREKNQTGASRPDGIDDLSAPENRDLATALRDDDPDGGGNPGDAGDGQVP